MGSLEQIGAGLIGGAAFGLVLIAIVSAALHYFVALNAKPPQRAFWTVAPAYLLVAAMGGMGGAGTHIALWAWPIGAIAPAAVAYWFWLRDFQKRWYENVDDLPDDVPLANHDWKNGLLQLAGLLVAGVVITLARRGFTL